nr:C40 family peptidase [Catellatospora chokoriensis]
MLIGVATAAAIALIGLPILLAAAVTGSGLGPGICAPAAGPTPSAGNNEFDPGQRAIAATIVDVGVDKGVPRWGWVVAIATALQESGLHNLPHLGDDNDHDSIGVFQQRPSQGWGTPKQLADPAYQAGRFYEKLLKIPGWDKMPLARAAQAVQISAYPNAYDKWADEALGLVSSIADTLTNCLTDAHDALPDDYTLPIGTPPAVTTAIFWALAQLGTPYHYGGSCTDPHSGKPDRQCDCSSLMQQAYRAAGISIPRTTLGQVHAGAAVPSVGLLKPGDLILIAGSQGTRAVPRHVGMYLGHGLIVQAPRTGDVVKVVPLSSWADQIAAIRRIAK